MVLGEAKIGEFLEIFLKPVFEKNHRKNSAEERHEKITNKNERSRVSIFSSLFLSKIYSENLEFLTTLLFRNFIHQ